MPNLPQTNLWETLPRPIIGLSPMSGVTDHAFRHIQKKHGNPMLLFTEFTSVDGLCAGASALLKDFLYDESQRPIIAQVYGRQPQNFYQTAILLCQLGFDGIDINMGCPSKNVTNAGAGAGLIRTPAVAQEIVRATRRGVQDWVNGATVRDCQDIPVAFIEEIEARHHALPLHYQQRRAIPISVKTRIGYDRSQVGEWIPQLLETEPAAITLHGRTLVQGYTGDSNWDEIATAAEIIHTTQSLILGNGDLRSLEDAYQRIDSYGVDGVLIGRASYGNPYIFREVAINGAIINKVAINEVATEQANGHGMITPPEPAKTFEEERYEILHIALEHAYLYEASFSHLDRYNFLPMRKHLGWYVRHLPGASHLRRTLTQTCNLDHAVTTITDYLNYRQTWNN